MTKVGELRLDTKVTKNMDEGNRFSLAVLSTQEHLVGDEGLLIV